MAEIAAIATVVSAVSGLAGSFMQANAAKAAGEAAQQQAEFEAAQLDIKAKDEQAAAQAVAEERKRNKELTLSNLQANAAASGFTATDPTALALADEIERYGTYQEQIERYGGATRRAGIEAQADATRYEGNAKKALAKQEAKATIIGGISSFAGSFAGRPSSYGSSSATSFRYG